MAKTMAEVLGELWDQGNCTGLDGWIGPGRGSIEVDDVALDDRRRDVEKASAALSAAGYGLVADARRSLELAALLAYEAVEDSALEQARAEAWDECAGMASRPDPQDNPYRKASNDDQ